MIVLIMACQVCKSNNTDPAVKCIGCTSVFHPECLSLEAQGITPEWLCDVCIDNIKDNFNFYLSTDELVRRLPNGLRFGHINIRGLLSKIDHIRILLRNCTFDVFSVTESHLDDLIDDADLSVQGYRLFRKDRNRQGGGVATYISENLETGLYK